MTMNIRLYNARILMPDFSISEGELFIRDEYIDRIIPTGSFSALGYDFSFDREMDLSGNLIIPGFKNAHTHSGMTFLRSFADDLPLDQWLQTQVFPMEAKLTAEDVYHLSKLAILEYLSGGITANADMYFYPESIAKASVDMGFKTVLISPLSNFYSDVETVEKEYEVYNAYDDKISYRLGFHAEYTCSKELLVRLAKLAERLKEPVFTHNSETRKEVLECKGRYGMTPTAFLDSLGMFSYGGGGYHCVHMEDADMDIFVKRKLHMITNPGSNTKLASGIADISAFLERNIPVSIGTDGPASNNCLDMFREMFLVTGLAKLRREDAAALPASEVLKMALTNGAHAMGLSDCDRLEPGKRADLTVIDLCSPNMQPLNHIVKNIVYSGSKSNIMLTMVDGKILYEKGRFFVGEDPLLIYQKANDIIRRLSQES